MWRAARATAATPESAGRYVDVHCHAFNVADLPAEGFLRDVILTKQIDQFKKDHPSLGKVLSSNKNAISIALDILASELRAKAPKPADEIKFLDQIDGGTRTAPTLAQRKDDDQKLLKGILKIIWDPKLMKQRIASKKLKGLSLGLLQEASLELKYLLRREVDPELSDLTKQPIDMNLDQNRKGSDLFDSDSIAEKAYQSNGPFGHVLRWLVLFTRYRFEIAEMLAQLNNEPGQAKLLTPALVDFEMWVRNVPDQDPPDPAPAPIADQIKVWGRISRRRGGPRVHGFVAFDPLRQLLYEQQAKHPAGSKAPLDTVQEAINNYGFIGVKLYPPMGFRPYGNGGKALAPAIVTKYKLPATAGQQLDEILLRLYTWCRDQGVPIMAHARDSNEASLGAGEDANPDNWERALALTAGGRNFADLHLNLAHAGEFQASVEQGRIDKDAWEYKVAALRKQYPNVYADMSYFNDVMRLPDRRGLVPEDQKSWNERVQQFARTRAEVLSKFKAFKREVEQADGFRTADVLMFGSDWIMLGIEVGAADQLVIGTPNASHRKSYKALVQEFLQEVGYTPADLEKIFFGNSVRFLGLTAGQPTRVRLEAFYRSIPGGDTGWLAEFDR